MTPYFAALCQIKKLQTCGRGVYSESQRASEQQKLDRLYIVIYEPGQRISSPRTRPALPRA
jgi:hypothetical protein